jgi:hypothetical protein
MSTMSVSFRSTYAESTPRPPTPVVLLDLVRRLTCPGPCEKCARLTAPFSLAASVGGHDCGRRPGWRRARPGTSPAATTPRPPPGDEVSVPWIGADASRGPSPCARSAVTAGQDGVEAGHAVPCQRLPVPLRRVLAESAAGLASRGFHVFPCLPGGKRPAVDRWEQRASADPAHVADAWRSRYAGHNIGIACGPSRLAVLDLDRHGELPAEWRLPGVIDGRDVFSQLCEWAGQPWPSTYWVATPPAAGTCTSACPWAARSATRPPCSGRRSTSAAQVAMWSPAAPS